MSKKKIISIGLATILSSSIYYNIYANSISKNEIEDNSNLQAYTVNNEVYEEYKKGKYSDDNSEKEEVVKSLKLLGNDLLDLFFEYGCIDEDGNLLGYSNLTDKQSEEIISYVEEIKQLQKKLFQKSYLSDEQKLRKEKHNKLNEEFGLVTNGVFDIEKFENMSDKQLELYRMKLKS